MNTIAILYPGDMGSHVAGALTGHGFRVVSFLEHRDDKTKENAMKTGVADLASMAEVAAVADLAISLVPPIAVKPVAADYIAAAAEVDNPARFVDMNAKSIVMADELSAMFVDAGLAFTNASIIGRASHVEQEGVIFTSGLWSPEVEDMLGQVFRVVYLGEEVPAATAFKMCFAGFNKTITAAIFEIAAAANRFGMTDRLFEEITEKMPGLVADVGRLIGNYPQHLTRRKQEMEELSGMLDSVSLPNHIASAAAAVLADIERRGDFDIFKDRAEPTFLELMKALHA